MNGILVFALGAAWNEVRLPHPVKVTVYCNVLYGAYANWLLTSIAAAFGTAANSPITSAGHIGQPRQESFVAVGFITVTIAIIATSILALWVFEERPPRSTIVRNIRNSTFPERRNDADHERGDRAALYTQSPGGTRRGEKLKSKLPL